ARDGLLVARPDWLRPAWPGDERAGPPQDAIDATHTAANAAGGGEHVVEQTHAETAATVGATHHVEHGALERVWAAVRTAGAVLQAARPLRAETGDPPREGGIGHVEL